MEMDSPAASAILNEQQTNEALLPKVEK